MGRLAEDMARLRGEIDNLRIARGALMRQLARGAGDLAQAVSAMTADFAAARADMAKKTRGERGAFLSGMIDDVHSLLEVFSGARSGTAADLTGARLAWHGHGLAGKKKEKDWMGEKPAKAGSRAKRGRK